jgi:hypothetical protein
MRVDKIYIRGGSKFSDIISNWIGNKSNETIIITDNFQEQFTEMDSLLIFNQNQNLSKEIQDLKSYFDKQQKAIHKIDINGTLMVGLSNLELWFERTKVKRVFISGSDDLIQNPNLVRYLSAID